MPPPGSIPVSIPRLLTPQHHGLAWRGAAMLGPQMFWPAAPVDASFGRVMRRMRYASTEAIKPKNTTAKTSAIPPTKRTASPPLVTTMGKKVEAAKAASTKATPPKVTPPKKALVKAIPKTTTSNTTPAKPSPASPPAAAAAAAAAATASAKSPPPAPKSKSTKESAASAAKTPTPTPTSASTSTSTPPLSSSSSASDIPPSLRASNILEKPEKFNPPSHGSRLPRKGGSRTGIQSQHYGGNLSEKEVLEQDFRNYPGLPPPKNSWSHWFINSLTVHMTLTLGTLSVLAFYVFYRHFNETSPYAHLVPPISEFPYHPWEYAKVCGEAFRLTELHRSQQNLKIRRHRIADADKRREYRRAHDMPGIYPPGMGNDPDDWSNVSFWDNFRYLKPTRREMAEDGRL